MVHCKLLCPVFMMLTWLGNSNQVGRNT
jgi:hypothetical protein